MASEFSTVAAVSPRAKFLVKGDLRALQVGPLLCFVRKTGVGGFLADCFAFNLRFRRNCLNLLLPPYLFAFVFSTFRRRRALPQ